MPPEPEDDIGSLERARKNLYDPGVQAPERTPLARADERSLPHAWEERELPLTQNRGARHVRLASFFLAGAALFFVASLGIAGYFFYFGSNSVSTDKITVDVQGPTTIAGGDTVPLSLTITNKNPIAIDNATIEIDFPSGTRSATDVLSAYPRYVENLGTLASGQTVTRSIRAVVFGEAGQTITVPVSLSYEVASSNATFVKKSSYAFAISSTPLSVSVDALSETVSGTPMTFVLTVRSNATIPLSNVVLANTLPFGFAVTSSSVPLNGTSFFIGTLAPGESRQITLMGTLSGQDGEQRVFHFTVGTVKSPKDQTPAVAYMTQDASVAITAPFITTNLVVNNNTSGDVVLTPASLQNVALSYANTLPTTVTNVVVTVAIAGSGIDYNSIKTTSGFYNSTNHSIIFSSDTDPALASLAPGASGIGNFTFSTLGAGALSPNVAFTVSVSGVRVGQSNVPEQVTSSTVTTAKVATAATVSSDASHNLGLASTGPVPPHVGQTTTYSVIWNVQNGGSPIAGGTVTATLPVYVTYTGVTGGAGTFSYNPASRTVTWNTGDLVQGANAQGLFQVSITPSTSQLGNVVTIANAASFSGYDRYAGVTVSATGDFVTTDTKNDPGYVPGSGIVQ